MWRMDEGEGLNSVASEKALKIRQISTLLKFTTMEVHCGEFYGKVDDSIESVVLKEFLVLRNRGCEKERVNTQGDFLQKNIYHNSYEITHFF